MFQTDLGLNVSNYQFILIVTSNPVVPCIVKKKGRSCISCVSNYYGVYSCDYTSLILASQADLDNVCLLIANHHLSLGYFATFQALDTVCASEENRQEYILFILVLVSFKALLIF